MQHFVVMFIVGLAVLYLGRRLYGLLCDNNQTGCNCDGCPGKGCREPGPAGKNLERT